MAQVEELLKIVFGTVQGLHLSHVLDSKATGDMCAKQLEVDCSQGRASKLGIVFWTSKSAKTFLGIPNTVVHIMIRFVWFRKSRQT